MSDKTRVYPQDGMPGEDDFLSGSAPDVMVSVTFEGPETSLPISSGEELKAREAGAVFIYGFLKPDAAALADGTKLDIWQYVGSTAYTAKDGTELLKVEEPVGPADAHYSGLSLSDLGETAQENITAWFEARGVLYDEQAELERACAAWLEAEDASDFQTWGLSQRRLLPHHRGAPCRQLRHGAAAHRLGLRPGDRRVHRGLGALHLPAGRGRAAHPRPLGAHGAGAACGDGSRL